MSFIKKIKVRLEYNRNTKAYASHAFSLTQNQSSLDEVLQLSHRLEKGMVNQNPRMGWGEDKAERLYELMIHLNDSQPDELFGYKTALGVLISYIEEKKRHNDYSDRIKKIDMNLKSINNTRGSVGGVEYYNRSELIIDYNERKKIINSILSRHSIRDFSSDSINYSDLFAAIDLANHCPSACNRQPYHVYVISGAEREKLDTSKVIRADKYLIITGRISAFSIEEYNDWLVSASIFAGYLSLCLHIYNIANCPIRMDLLERAQVYKNIRDYCRIPETEQIILEFAIGNYRDSCCVPKSNRMNAELLCTICDCKENNDD